MTDDDGTAWPFIVLREDEAIGYLQVWRDNDGAAGLDMFLAPAFRGRGFGARAASAVARYLSDAGWSRLTVDPAVYDGPSELMVFCRGKGTGTEP